MNRSPSSGLAMSTAYKLQVPSLPVLAHISYHIVIETELRDVICRIAICDFSVFVLAYFLACVWDCPCSRWATDANIPSRGARGILF